MFFVVLGLILNQSSNENGSANDPQMVFFIVVCYWEMFECNERSMIGSKIWGNRFTGLFLGLCHLSMRLLIGDIGVQGYSADQSVYRWADR